MRGLIDGIRERLQHFLTQRDDVALVLLSPDADTLPILKTLEGLEAENASDLFWTSTDAFRHPQQYAAAIVNGFASRHGAVRLAMEREGMEPWPPVPEPILSDRTPPAQRLRELAAFSRELLPIPGGGNNVWIYYPLELGDAAAFGTLMRDVLRHEFPFPWCHGLRFILRENPAAPALQTALAGSPRIHWYQPDLSAEAIQRSLQADAADESLPLAERMGNLQILAGADAGQQRYADALQKYEILLQYHAPMGNYPMAALALNGMGEAYEKLGDLERAGESYQAALIPASQGDQPPVAVLLNVVLNLASLRFVERRWAESEAYYDAAQQLATAARDGATKVRALEYRGVCQQQQGKLDDAERSWIDGSALAAQLEDVALCRAQVERLRQQYAATGRVLEEQERRAQLEALGPAPKG